MYCAAIVPLLVCPHIEDMAKTLGDAVRRALELAPASTLALARRAGVSSRLLRMIRDGERTATRATTEALLHALDEFTAEHADAARVLREALEAGGDDDA